MSTQHKSPPKETAASDETISKKQAKPIPWRSIAFLLQLPLLLLLVLVIMFLVLAIAIPEGVALVWLLATVLLEGQLVLALTGILAFAGALITVARWSNIRDWRLGLVSAISFLAFAGEIYDAPNLVKFWLRPPVQVTLTAAKYSPDGTRIVTADEHGTARIWDASTGRQLTVLSYSSFTLLDVAYSPDGKRIVTAGDDGVHVWDAVSGKAMVTQIGGSPPIGEQEVKHVAYSPDGKRVATVGIGDVRIWDPGSGRLITVLSGSAQTQDATFSPNGTQIATVHRDGSALIWDATTGKELVVFKIDTALESVAYNPDGQHLATGDLDGIVRIWEVVTGKELVDLKGHGGSVQAVSYSPDGRQIVTTSWFEQTACIWEAATGNELMVLSGHTKPVVDAQYSPDGKRILTASLDGTARVWHAATGQQVLVLR